MVCDQLVHWAQSISLLEMAVKAEVSGPQAEVSVHSMTFAESIYVWNTSVTFVTELIFSFCL